jgi:hypothetical protein
MRTLSFVAHPVWKHWLVPDACVLLVVVVPVELPREVPAVVVELAVVVAVVHPLDVQEVVRDSP